MEQDLADHVQKYIMTVGKNTDVDSLDVPSDVNVTVIWRSGFTQFDNDGHNNYTELEQKNIDTGMGLERLACIVQDVDSMFDIDTLKALRDHVCNMAGVEYQEDDNTDTSIRVLTDHIHL